MRVAERASVVAYVALGLFALAVSRSATSLYGLGLDGDGVLNLSAGVHFAQGRGLVTCRDTPLTLWPPLYPLVVSALELVGIDLLTGLRALHLAALATTLVLSARLAFVLSGSRWAELATLGSLALSSRMHEFTIQVGSETFFATLLLASLLAAHAWLERPTRTRWIALIVFSALACLQRYVGVAVVLTIAGALVLVGPGALAARVSRAAAYSASAVAPLVVWFVRNYRIEGAPTGGREAPHQPLSTILVDGASTLARWIVPDGAPLWIAALVYAFLALLFVRVWRERSRRTDLLLATGVAVGFALLVVAMAATVRVDRLGDRLLFPALPPLVALAWSLCFNAARSRVAFAALLLVVGCAWSTGALRLAGHWQRWRNDGAGTLHTRLWQEHPLTRELRQRSIEGPCWSNAPELVWMLQRIPVRFLAAGGKAWERAGERASESGGTLAWFQDGGRPKGSLRELEQRARVTPIATVEDGLLLRLEPEEKR